MPDGREAVTVHVTERMAEIAPDAWDGLAGGGNPFLTHAFLNALEESGSAVPETGWLPRHLVLEDSGGGLIGAAPLYVKSHSLGEYVFDQGWAQAYEQAGGQYYPKLQACVPFTPVPGPRLLARDTEGEAVLAAAMIELARRAGLSSVHVTFVDQAQAERLAGHGFLSRAGYQFHWNNRGYESFDDFLRDLSSRKRKSIRRERGEAMAGLKLRVARGRDIRESDWDAFFEFYLETGSRKWGRPYLTRAFFSHLAAAMPDHLLLFLAEGGGKPVAGALNLIGRDALYGRYWGAAQHYPFLHFELCYYQAIEFAIAHKLARVEAGAQGEHKVQRGYLPAPIWSAHYIADPGLREPVAAFLERERLAVEAEMAALAAFSPFKT